MSVDEWAREQAEECIPAIKAFGSRPPSVPHVERIRFADGIVHAFDALLSDEAVEAMVRQWWELRESGPANLPVAMRAALQAAIDAVTKEARND